MPTQTKHKHDSKIENSDTMGGKQEREEKKREHEANTRT